MKADRTVVEEPIEGSRQDVLAGVLLHVIEPPAPVDFAANGCALVYGRRQHMDHIVIKVERVDDVDRGPIGSAPLPTVLTRPTRVTRPKQLPGIKRLSAGCRIESGSIENHCRSSLMKGRCCHCGVELPAVRIGVVEAGGHAASSDAAGSSK